jgi:hypothetical protein
VVDLTVLQTCKLSGELSSMIQTDNQLSEPEACESTIKARPYSSPYPVPGGRSVYKHLTILKEAGSIYLAGGNSFSCIGERIGQILSLKSTGT